MSYLITRSTDAATITPDKILAPFEADDEPQSIVHDILGRTFPDVTLRPAKSAEGTLRLFFPTPSEAEAARLFHRSPATFALTSPVVFLPARYVPQGSIRRAQQEPSTGAWVLEVGFRELAP